jgi:hypothetical protein
MTCSRASRLRFAGTKIHAIFASASPSSIAAVWGSRQMRRLRSFTA